MKIERQKDNETKYLNHKQSGYHQKSFPDLSKYDEIAIDLETKDPELKTMGSGSVTSKGNIVGIAVAVHDWAGYYPIRHEGGGNMDQEHGHEMV